MAACIRMGCDMADQDNRSSNKKEEKHGILCIFIQRLFHRKSEVLEEAQRSVDEYHREPKYWPEVRRFY